MPSPEREPRSPEPQVVYLTPEEWWRLYVFGWLCNGYPVGSHCP